MKSSFRSLKISLQQQQKILVPQMPQQNYCWQGKLQRIVKLASQNAQNAGTGIRYFSCGMKGLPRPPAEDSGDHSQAADSHPALALFVSANHKLQSTFLKHADGRSKTKIPKSLMPPCCILQDPLLWKTRKKFCAKCIKKSHLRMHCLLHGRDSNWWRWQWLWNCISENLLHTVLETNIRVKKLLSAAVLCSQDFSVDRKSGKNPTSKNPSPFSNFKGAQNLAMSATPTPKPQILSSDTEKERQSSPRYGCDQRDNEHRQARYWPPPPPAPPSPSS